MIHFTKNRYPVEGWVSSEEDNNQEGNLCVVQRMFVSSTADVQRLSPPILILTRHRFLMIPVPQDCSLHLGYLPCQGSYYQACK